MEHLRRIAEFYVGSRSPRAVAGVCLGFAGLAVVVAVALWALDRVGGLGGLLGGAGLLALSRSPAWRPADVLMTLGLLVLGAAFLVAGTLQLASGTEPDVLGAAMVVALLLFGAGYGRFRRRVGVERANAWWRGLVTLPRER